MVPAIFIYGRSVHAYTPMRAGGGGGEWRGFGGWGVGVWRRGWRIVSCILYLYAIHIYYTFLLRIVYCTVPYSIHAYMCNNNVVYDDLIRGCCLLILTF